MQLLWALLLEELSGAGLGMLAFVVVQCMSMYCIRAAWLIYMAHALVVFLLWLEAFVYDAPKQLA